MKKILIVEDNHDAREIMNLFITKMGYTSIAAKNSSEAIALAEAEAPDLIFMDMQLPDVDGVQTTALIKQNPKTAGIPIVALTAWMSQLWQEKASERYCKLFNKTDLVEDIKGDHRSFHKGAAPSVRCSSAKKLNRVCRCYCL